jgi:hypothetical protein
LKPPARGERLELRDRNGLVVGKLSPRQYETLREKQLVEPIGRRSVLAVRLAPGSCVASLHAALRNGIREQLPRAECQSTIKRVRVDGYGEYITLHRSHLAGWGIEIDPLVGE